MRFGPVSTSLISPLTPVGCFYISRRKGAAGAQARLVSADIRLQLPFHRLFFGFRQRVVASRLPLAGISSPREWNGSGVQID